MKWFHTEDHHVWPFDCLVYVTNNHVATFRKYGRKSQAQWQMAENVVFSLRIIHHIIYMHFKRGQCCWRTWHTVVVVKSHEPILVEAFSRCRQILMRIQIWSNNFEGKQYQSYYGLENGTRLSAHQTDRNQCLKPEARGVDRHLHFSVTTLHSPFGRDTQLCSKIFAFTPCSLQKSSSWCGCVSPTVKVVY